MSIYSYKSAKSFCQFLDIQFEENILVSDQELSKIPEGWIKGRNPTIRIRRKYGEMPF